MPAQSVTGRVVGTILVAFMCGVMSVTTPWFVSVPMSLMGGFVLLSVWKGVP